MMMPCRFRAKGLLTDDEFLDMMDEKRTRRNAVEDHLPRIYADVNSVFMTYKDPAPRELFLGAEAR